jgi:hypothetical protein
MSLSKLIRKSELEGLLSATPAIRATDGTDDRVTVARIATVASSNPGKLKTASPEITSRAWLIHYVDREPMTVICVPEESHTSILEHYRDAIAAEPLTEPVTKLVTTLPTIKAEDIDDGRRLCTQCRNLSAVGVCIVARPGGPVSANRGYKPSIIHHRCPAFTARPGVDVPAGAV